MIDGKQNGIKKPSVNVAEMHKNQNAPIFAPQPDETAGEIRRNYQTCYNDIQEIIVKERNTIMHCRIKEEEKNDLLTLLEAFKDNVFMGNKEQVRMSFVSYKYAATSFKKFYSEVDDIERILKFCKIL